jgi:hypothetical protein
MPRRFNTAGPCDPADHYMVPVATRLPIMADLVDQKAYFDVHAPRQIGKTTTLLTLAQELARAGKYSALLVSMEAGAAFPHDIGAAELVLLDELRSAAAWQLPTELQPPPFPDAPPGRRLGAALAAWAHATTRPLVVFLDEIDALQDEALVSVLRQLRSGFTARPRRFPHSLALIGLRDVRDYKVAAGGSDRLGTASPFNIKAESLTLLNFTHDEVAALYAQHTGETGQLFLPDAVDRAFALTAGQPWLVNALARQLVEVLVKDRSTAITRADVDRAKDILIERQDTHLDSLAERLREPRVRAIIEPMLAGTTPEELPTDDIRFAIDLGLVRMTTSGGLDVANPIYREIIVRQLTLSPRAALPTIQPTWLTPEGRLDPDRLIEAFLDFWRQHGEPLLGTAPYHEVAPQLVFMAFLQRVVNGGGSVEREYAIGRGRMDLCVRYAGETLGIELKVWRDGRKDPLEDGLVQLDAYLAGLGVASGWLMIFDRRSAIAPIAERTRRESAKTADGRDIAVIRA